ncbi:MAG: hypothetical protein IPL73_02090 [Candidatus Obscuribacter sp.]|nr:hypothetical protein [Candidatus Obscuribacter sp.]
MKVKMDRAKIWLPLANTLLLMAASCGNSAFALDDAAKPTTATTGNTAAFTPATDPDNPAVRFSNSEALKRAIDAVKDDVVMRAMGDELDRSMKNLKLPNYPLPYYGHYYVTDEEFIQISGSFGALSNKDSTRTRHSEVTLRVGDEKLDNTTMAGGLSGFGNYNVLVRDDNYDAIRRDLWSQTDRAYKSAVESLAELRLSSSTSISRIDRILSPTLNRLYRLRMALSSMPISMSGQTACARSLPFLKSTQVCKTLVST